MNESRKWRLRRANVLIQAISRKGRKFFSCPDGSWATFEFDDRGRLWWNDRGGQKVYLHQPDSARLNGFSEGGTLRNLVMTLKVYIMDGNQLRYSLGPWPLWLCEGDLWGYGNDMEHIRKVARRLGILQ
jgi:hypothetical protein